MKPPKKIRIDLKSKKNHYFLVPNYDKTNYKGYCDYILLSEHKAEARKEILQLSIAKLFLKNVDKLDKDVFSELKAEARKEAIEGIIGLLKTVDYEESGFWNLNGYKEWNRKYGYDKKPPLRTEVIERKYLLRLLEKEAIK